MATELAIAAPLVVIERFTRMALAGPSPSEHDGKEFLRMYTEKMHAFTESWLAMTTAIIRANQGLASSFFRPFTVSSLSELHGNTIDILDQGMAPLHRTTMDNVVRLSRKRG
jgi:hypothetical protein